MKFVWKRSLIALALVATIVIADIGMGLELSSLFSPGDDLPGTDDGATQAMEAVERTWEGGGAYLAFADTMSGGQAEYFEQMDPLRDAPGEGTFDYYGGAIPQVDEGEVLGRWGPDRWRHEWWRWGEESFRDDLEEGRQLAELWWQDDAWPGGGLRFSNAAGDDPGYPEDAFSAIISPVVDLRDVEPIARDTEEAAEYRFQSPTPLSHMGAVGTPIVDVRENVANMTRQTGVVEVGDRFVTADAPAIHNASAALRLRHLYDFFSSDSVGLRDGASVEVARFDPGTGWQEWEALAPSHNKLRLGEEEFEGRYAAPVTDAVLSNSSAGVHAWYGEDIDGEAEGGGRRVPGDGSLNNITRDPAERPWLYQGRIGSSSVDSRGAWAGFGGESNGLVESVFDLSEHAGHVVRLRFVTATGEGNTLDRFGWLLEQLEVHALAESGVKVLAPVTPTQGALLGMDQEVGHSGARPVVALQNTGGEEVRVRVHMGIEGNEGKESTREHVTLPPGPWGRVFVSGSKTLEGLGLEQPGLHHLSVDVERVFDEVEGLEVRSPVPLDQGRYHFLRVGPDWLEQDASDKWRAVNVETELLPMPGHEEDDHFDPTGRVINRGQEMMIHVDLENLGPEPVSLEFNACGDQDEASPLCPSFMDRLGDPVGAFEIETPEVTLPPSREASGSLGDPEAVKRVTWKWQGTDFAEILRLIVADERGEIVLEGGTVRVETMQPNAFDVDFSNRWDYAAADGCMRDEVDRRTVLACAGGSITSPASPVANVALRRGLEAHLVVLHRGDDGNIIFEAVERGVQSDELSPPTGLDWSAADRETVAIPQSEHWTATRVQLHTFPSSWSGWIRVTVEGDADGTLVDEVRVEVGPENRRFPLLWHTFTGDWLPETSGTIRASGDHVAVLHGTAVRTWDHAPELDCPSGVPFGFQNSVRNICSFPGEEDISLEFGDGGATVDRVIPAMSLLQLPDTYPLDGARPTLRFDHWMGPSVSAAGHVEVARLDSALLRSLEDGREVNITWESVASFSAPRSSVDAQLQSVEVGLGDYAGDEIMIRFRYAYDAALQPGITPKGWVLDAVAVDQVQTNGAETLYRSSGNFTQDGYWGFQVDYEQEVQGVQRSRPWTLTRERAQELHGNDEPFFPNPDLIGPSRDGWLMFTRGDPEIPICADRNHPNTKPVGQSAITDSVDLRALVEPVLLLEHDGRFRKDSGFSRNLLPGTKIMDLEWQVLGPDGRWGDWNRATPHQTWTGWGSTTWSGEREDGGLADARTGEDVNAPFTNATSDFWDEHGNLNAFDLRPLSGEIARFRFIVWEEWEGHSGSAYGSFGCHWTDNDQGVHHRDFIWNLYSMRVFEDTHIFDASVDLEDNVRVRQDDREVFERFGSGGRELEDGEVVVSGYSGQGGRLDVEVDVRNLGSLRHVANVTLALLDETGSPVDDAQIRFVDRDTETSFSRPHGSLALEPIGEAATGTVAYHVEIAGVEPGRYRLQAVVDLDDAIDTNPHNDVFERPLRVVPFRALDFDPSMRVDPPATTPEDLRTLRLTLRNQGNVEEGNVTVKARVVELIGFGAEADIGPEGPDGNPQPYELESQSIKNMAPGSTRSFSWDLATRVEDSTAGLDLAGLLDVGSRYAVNVTIHPAEDSVRSWWEAGETILLESQDGDLVDLVSPPGERCECYYVPFFVEDRIAGSDFTPEGTTDVLGWSNSDTLEDLMDQWESVTRYRQDGRMVELDRTDLPTWEIVDAARADEELGRSGVQGAAWHLPAYEGFERLEHELVSPPLPGHVIENVSRGILDLRYASDLHENQARLEVRTLEPGGMWGPWHAPDDMRTQRVALVLPPDYPRVISDRFSDALHDQGRYPAERMDGHPVPPFYTQVDDGEKRCWWIEPEGDPNRSPDDGCPGWFGSVVNHYGFVNAPNRYWSPFPLFREPDDSGNDGPLEALGLVLQRLVDEYGPNNVRVFTTFPENPSVDDCTGLDSGDAGWVGCFGEFGVPTHEAALDDFGVRFNTHGAPALDVASDPVPYKLPLLGLDELGRRIDTYTTVLLMGDGLSRWAASAEGRSDVLGSDRYKVLPEVQERFDDGGLDASGFHRPVDPDHGTPELERHFQELLPALRFAPNEGVRVIGATGPATASVGRSGVAEGVPLSLWIPPNTGVSTSGRIETPFAYRCIVDLEPEIDGRPRNEVSNTEENLGFLLNQEEHPKEPCVRPGRFDDHPTQPTSAPNSLHPANIRYVSAPDQQAIALRNLLGGSSALASEAGFTVCSRGAGVEDRRMWGFMHPEVQGPVGLNVGAISLCVVPDPLVSQQERGITFITAPFSGNETARDWTTGSMGDFHWNNHASHAQFTGDESVETWVDEVIAQINRLRGETGLPAGTGGWEHLPMDRGAPVGGAFRADATGRDLFVGETMQFRIVVDSDPQENPPGHGRFLLDSFQLLGTPREEADVHVQVVEPHHGAIRAPNERHFHAAVEVLNRGLSESTEDHWVVVELGQIPGRGDCTSVTRGGGGCLVQAFHPHQDGPATQEILVPAPSGGARHVVTLGGPERSADPGAPPAIMFSRDGDAFNDGRFPNPSIPRLCSDDDETSCIEQEEDRFALFNVSARLLNDPDKRDEAVVTATTDIRDVIKDTSRDIRINPSQAALGTGEGPIPATDKIEVDLRLTNDGSRPNQEVRVRVEIRHAVPHDCWDNSLEPADMRFIRCDAEGNPLGRFAWREDTGFSVERGTTLETFVDVDPAEVGLEPGVYEVAVTVRTLDQFGSPVHASSASQWLYLTDETGPWALYGEDLTGIASTNDLNTHRMFPPTSSEPDSTPWFVVGTRDYSCMPDGTTRSSTSPDLSGNSEPLLHGWAFGGDGAHVCADLFVAQDGQETLQWVRDPRPSAQDRHQSWFVGTNQQSPADVGLNDFGPDRIVWYPGHDVTPHGDVPRGDPNGVAPTLANFQSGTASLAVDTRFAATERTGFIVEMQVARRVCDQVVQDGVTRPQTCQWQWSNSNNRWIPLSPELPQHIDVTDPGDWSDRPNPGQGNNQRCTRSVNSPDPPFQTFNCHHDPPSNPLSGLPGLWGRDSRMEGFPGADDNGWVTLRYPIDPEENAALASHCRGGGLSVDCAYTRASLHTGEEIPRPVAFRFSAASFGGDAGENFWELRGLSLTSHALSVERNRFEVSMSDGESRMVPVEIRNDGPVDDYVEVTVDVQDDPGFDVGVARSVGREFEDSLALRIPPGQWRTVWVNVSTEFGLGGLRPGDYDLPEILVTARSVIAEAVSAVVEVDASVLVLPRADLAVGEMVVNNRVDDGEPVAASEGSPVHVSLQLQNEGTDDVTDPVLVRLWAQRIDEATGEPVCPDGETKQGRCMEAVAVHVVEESFDRNCFDPRCGVSVNFEWTPQQQGAYELLAEMNLPRADDVIVQVPEAVFGNNVAVRHVIVGPVPLADLHIREVRLVPFDDGCATRDEAVSRLVQGHDYCVVARVANEGSMAALFPTIDFSIGASDAFSRGQGWTPERFEAGTDAWVSSSPVRALRTPTADGAMEFRVEVDTDTLTASVSGMESRVRVPVDRYGLELRSSELSDMVLAQGGEATLVLDVRNTGTAVATPLARIEGETGDLRVSLEQSPPLQPGESTLLTLVARAGFSAPEGPQEVRVALTTAEDSLVRVRLPFDVEVAEEQPVKTTLLPLHMAPGKGALDLIADNTDWSTDGTWTPLEATGVLTITSPGVPLPVKTHDVGVHELPVRVPAHTPPGDYNGTVRFQVEHGPLATTVESSYKLSVLPAPGLQARLMADHTFAVRGVDANVTVRLHNTGNQPVEVVLESQVDSGVVPHNETTHFLEPGREEHIDVRVRPGDASRSLGETLVRWRVADEQHWHAQEEPLLWTVRHLSTGVRLESTNLEELEPRAGRTETVRATLLNPGNQEMDAEAVLVAGSRVEYRQVVTLGPGEIEAVELLFRLDEPGEHVLHVVVRPAGSQVTLTDSVFHEVGDVHTRELEIAQSGDDGAIAAPAAGLVLLLAALLCLLAAFARWRRPGQPRRSDP